MKKSVRILALLLSGLMLASGLVSCKKEEEKKDGEVNVDIPENEGPVLEVPA